MSTLREYEQALERDPTQKEPFLALRKAYRESGTWDKLITLYELRAQALTDAPKASELFYLAAEIRLDHLDDVEGAEADLAHAIDRDPDNAKAAHRLKLLYRQQGRPAEYMTMLEVEAAAVGHSKDPARISELSTELGLFAKESFAKLERAAGLSASQRQTEVTPEALKLVESARKIYRALGDFQSVVRLYDLELSLTSEAKRRSDLLLGLGRVLGEKVGDLEGAAQRLGEVVRLRPRDDRALEALAAVYANPGWLGNDGKERAATTYYQIARRRHEAGDVDNAVAALRKALAAIPGHNEASDLLEQVLYGARRLADLDLYYRERVAEAVAPADAAPDQQQARLEERMDFLFKRAQLAEGDRQDLPEALRIYQEIVAIEPPGGPASQRLGELFAGQQDWARLAELREKQLERIEDPAFRLAVLTELALLYRDRLGDPEQAAVYWHAILEEHPNHPEALTAYAEHFRERGDWPALVELLEFSFEHARGSGRPLEELLERLEEIAVISESKMGDSERALSAWQRMDELSPGHDRAREAQKRILQKGKQWDRMVAVLEREAQTAADPAVKAETLGRLARVLVEKLNAGDRAAQVYQQILALEPKHPVAIRSLVDLYERDERWSDLAALLRGQLEASASKQDKAANLRRLLLLYTDRLNQLAEGSWAAAEILKLAPGDRDALERLEAILEQSDDKERLVETLEYHTRYAATNEEKLALYLRIADLLQNKIGDEERAMRWWEEILRLAPGDATALDALAAGYERLGKPEDLAKVLEQQISQAAQDPSVQASGFRRLATLAEGKLADPRRAQVAWEELLRATPSDPQALEALSRIYAEKKEWRTLVGVLERRIPLAADSQAAVALALERARIFEEELRIRSEAVAALEQIVDELDPRCLPAFERLRRLAEAGGDWLRVVAVAEKQLFLEEDPNAKAERALEIGVLWRDRLGDPRRAMAAFERAVEIEPNSYEALTALAALYTQAGEWQRLVLTDEKLLEQVVPGNPDTEQERWRLMFEIGDTADQQLGDSRTAFDWYRRAYNEGANPEALTRLEDVAQRHKLWDELVAVFEGARARATDPAGQVAIARKIAGIVETSLGDPGRAFSGLREALAAEPAATTLLPELERLAEAADQWDGLLEVYAQVARHRRDPGERLALLRKRAEVREQKLNDPYGAMDEQLRAFALVPDEESTRLEISRLAEITGRWEDALGIEAQRFARAREDAGDAKVEIACRAAALVEEKLKDRRRAFRAYLNAFRLAPENAGVVANLWRLAAVVEADVADVARSGKPEKTMELSLTDISAMTAAAAAKSPERTMELSLTDIAAMSTAAMSRSGAAAIEPETEATEELVDSELIEEVSEDEENNDGYTNADQITPIGTTEDVDQPPPLRPKRVAPIPPPTPSPIVRTPPPVVSAWAEFAQAYELLPAPDTATRHKHLRKVAEIWEKGSKDIERALATLERAFRLDLSDQSVRGDLRRIATEQAAQQADQADKQTDRVDWWDAVCAIFLRAADAANRDEAVSLHHEVARFREDLGQPKQAEACYQAILLLKPEDEVALAHLETVLRTSERWPELAALLDKRTTGSLEALPPGTIRRQRTLELAELYDTRLERPYEAIDTFERFVGSVDEDARGSDDPQVVRENADALEALARLYAKVGMWAKAVEALQRQIELGPEAERLRTLKLRLAEISERELGQVDQAVGALESILESSPRDLEVLAALDRLLEGQGRYEALQEVIARRVELASESEKRALIRRRANILEERLGNADAAAAALRALGAEAVRDEETLAALLRNLGRAGLAHEALRVLAQKIELLTADRAPPAKIATLHLQIAALRLDRLDDLSAARTSIEEALKLQPDSGEALGALARLHLRASDFPAYARTRAREAAALGNVGLGAASAEAWLDAGRVYRDQLSDGDEARVSFEKALAADPHSAGALRALAGLLAADGRAGDARALYERQLELVDDPAAKAAVLTDLARTLLVEKPGEVNLAVARLDEALDLVPDHLPAVISMADIFYREQQWVEAERRLLQAIRRLKGQPAEMAQLYHRLGEVYDKLGRLDEGYRQLQEADRMLSGQLLIRLALGENRYQAKKWREATSYLEGLSDHPDAHKYPMEVAEGLAHGASAEVRLKRPERAVALYQAALRFMPDHHPSLQALAELALERGERAEAAQYLRRLAEGSGDRAERARLFEQLGDVVQSLGDDQAACKAYTDALAQLDQPTEAQAALLDKAFASQRSIGADKDAASTLQRLIALTPDPRQRAARRREAALLFEQQGEHGHAGELLEQALEESPKDEAVLASVVAAYERGKRKAELEKVLAATLPGLDAVADNPKSRTRRAELWEKLADLRKRKNKEGAIEALETAVSVDGGRMSARASLAKLYGDKAEYAAAALANHRELVRVDVTREDSLRRMAEAYMAEGRVDAARCCLEVLSLLGHAEKEDRTFLAAHPQPERRPEDPYAAAIEDADRAKYLAHPEARSMAELFAAIWEGVPGLGLQTLDSLGLTAQDKVSPIADVMIAQIFGQTAKALGNRRASLYVSPRPEFTGLSILLPPPPAIVVGQGVTDQDAPALRFLLGRALELSRPEYILAAGMDRREFAQLLTSVLKAFHPRHAKWRAGEAGTEQAQKLKKALPYKLAKRLAELFQEHEATAWGSARWRSVVAETGNRTGLVLCGDLATAVRIVLAESGAGGDLDADVVREQSAQATPLRELLRYAISEEYFAAREILGTAVSSKAAA